MRAALIALLIVVSALVPATSAVADDLDDRLDAVADDIDAIKSAIEGAEGRRSAISDEILAVDIRLQGLIEDLDQANADLAAVTADVAATRADLELAQAELEISYRTLEGTRVELETSKGQARERALSIYMGGGENFDSVVFTVDQVGDLGVGVEYANQVIESTEHLLNGLEALEVQVLRQTEIIERQEDRLADDVFNLERQQAMAAELAVLVAAKKQEVEDELAAQQARLAEVRAQISEFEAELDGLEAEQARIEELIREQQNPSGPPPSGRFWRPVPGPITSGFGPRVHPILGYTRMHTGIDMSAGYGTPIAAAADGRVIHAGPFGGYGNAVIIDHGGGIATLYAHQSQVAVGNGSSVSGGSVVGYVGSTGLSTGPHLHFEVRVNGSPVNPVPYL